jgi:hypothetical protein
MVAPKTTAVVLKDGRSGRGVKVTRTNFKDIPAWTGDPRTIAVYREGFTAESAYQEYDQRVRVRTLKGVRVAKIGDLVIKLSTDDCIIVKAENFAALIEI